VYYNGSKVVPDAAGEIRFNRVAEGNKNVLAVRANFNDEFADAPEFLLARTSMEPGSWTFNGLPYYLGSAAYERKFDLPPAYMGRKLVLDCG